MPNLFDVKYFLKTHFLGYTRELYKNITLSPKQHSHPDKKFLILSSGRSGSTLLENILFSNPDIHCEGELLRGKNLWPKRLIQLSENVCPKPIFGFKLLTYQLEDIQTAIPDKKQFLTNLVEQGYKIIYLERSNSLLQALSVIYAMQRNVWHYKNEDTVKNQKILLNPQKLSRTVQDLEDFKLAEKKLLENLPYIYLNYEQDLSQPEKIPLTVKKLSEYLDTPLHRPSIHLKKVTPRQLSSFISNYREVMKFIKSQKQLEQFAGSMISL